MKKLTLNQTWKLCLQQWKWIAGQIRKGTHKSVGDLKNQWMDENGFESRDDNCFFCIYADCDCPDCPARKVDKGFHCEIKKYDYWNKPLAFYAKLLELNRKRKGKK